MVLTTPSKSDKVVAMKKIATVLASLVMMTSLVACSSEVGDQDIDTGVVTYSHRKTVKVLEDDGEMDSHRVSRGTARKCSVGTRWPDCKNSR